MKRMKRFFKEWGGCILYILILLVLFGSLAGAGIMAGIAIEKGETIFSNR
ncbi:MAG: hypothetical protein ABIJ28_00295 [Patescibacteria group bacterium]